MPTLADLTQFVTFHSAAAQEHLWEWFSAQVDLLILSGELEQIDVDFPDDAHDIRQRVPGLPPLGAVPRP